MVMKGLTHKFKPLELLADEEAESIHKGKEQ